jgi:Tfp pilus assembly protein PilE
VEKHQRLCSGDSMRTVMKRSGMAMIELIFAIVIIAISVMTIPSMMNVADQNAKLMVVDEDLMARLSGWTMDKFQARWDGNYSASDSGPLIISTTADLNCSRAGGYRIGSDENISSMQCNPIAWDAVIPASGDGNVSKGIEELNGGSEPITITPAGGTSYTVTATYAVSYVDSTVATNGNTQTATWKLGSSGTPNPDGSLTNATHLKRVVISFQNSALDVNTTLTFFKSNKGN